MSEWNFDKKHLKFAIEKGKLLLTKKDISNYRIKGINSEISMFNKWLNDDYSFLISTSNNEYDLSDLKREIMHEVKLCGGFFGRGYISLITKLVESDLFNISITDNKLLSTDEQVDITMKTYNSYSPKFSGVAEKILLPNNSHIQVVNDIKSYSFGSTHILNEGFVVLNPNEGNGILNYHVQESIEELVPFGYSLDYNSLGPILFELLFHDKLYEENNIKYSSDYYSMIKKIREQLIDILPILKLFITTRSSNRDEINDDLFGDLCYKYFGTDNLEIVYNQVHNVTSNVDISYILSFLKAIDLREKIVSNGIDAVDLLSKFKDDFIYTPTVINSKFDIYNRYMDEINNKCK